MLSESISVSWAKVLGTTRVDPPLRSHAKTVTNSGVINQNIYNTGASSEDVSRKRKEHRSAIVGFGRTREYCVVSNSGCLY